MAKTTATPVNTDAQPTELSAKVKKMVDGVRETFTAFKGNYIALKKARDAFAPTFVKAFDAWKVETSGTFIGFVRLLDPSVPMAQKDYRDNDVYNAAIYIRRKIVNPPGDRVERVGDAPATPMAGMARLIAAIKPLVPEDQLTKLWQIIAKELHWSEDQKARLEKLVEEAEPLLAVRAPKGGARPVLRIAQPRHPHTNGHADAATA